MWSASNADELRSLRETVRRMLKENGAPPSGKWADIAVLEPVRDYKARHASTLLTFDAVVSAIDQIEAKRGRRWRPSNNLPAETCALPADRGAGVMMAGMGLACRGCSCPVGAPARRRQPIARPKRRRSQTGTFGAAPSRRASPADRPPYCITLETVMAFAGRVKAHVAQCSEFGPRPEPSPSGTRRGPTTPNCSASTAASARGERAASIGPRPEINRAARPAGRPSPAIVVGLAWRRRRRRPGRTAHWRY